jgi:hypothetical protein
MVVEMTCVHVVEVNSPNSSKMSLNTLPTSMFIFSTGTAISHHHISVERSCVTSAVHGSVMVWWLTEQAYKSKTVALHAMVALGGGGRIAIAPTHSFPLQ